MAKGKHANNLPTQRRALAIAATVVVVLAAALLIAMFLLSQSASLPENAVSSTPNVEAEVNDSPVSQSAVERSEKLRAEAEEEQRQAAEEAEAAKDFTGKITCALIAENVPDGVQASPFTLNGKRELPEITETQLGAIEEAAAEIEEAGYEASCLIVDLKSGRGVAYNAATPIYTASSFKAVLSTYLLENGLASEWEHDLIESSILYSDNDAYESLALGHMDAGWREWLAEHNVEYDDWSPWYPKASAIGMASCWLDTVRFLAGGEEDAAWLEGLLAETNLSFIRNALEGEEVLVWNKAGWITDAEFGNSVSDCAIVEADERRYLVVAMSSQPTYGEAHERLQNLVRTLFDCREDLR